MMMRERFRTRNQRPFFRVAALIALIALFVLFGTGFGPFIRDVFVGALVTVEPDEYALLSKETLAARLKDAEQELSRTRYQSILFTLLTEENDRLRAAANAVSVSGGITARVLGRPPQTHYDSLLIDRGTRDGLSSEDLVVFEGVALGRVTSLGARSATVELFSSPGSEHDVLLGNPPAISIARGLGGGAFELSVPQEVSVETGDTIRLPASESLVLGVVLGIMFEPNDISKVIRFSTPVSFAELDFVQVMPGLP